MESEKVTVKQEPPDEVEDGDKVSESHTLQNGPEFVNIKLEIDTEESNVRIKQEAEDPQEVQNGEESSASPRRTSWEVPIENSVHPSQCLEVSIKVEADETEQSLNHGSPLPSTSNNDSQDPEYAPNRNHLCPICSKAFANSANVQRHLLIHSRETYKCETCDVVYVDKQKLEKHIFNKHVAPKEKSYPCDSCDKTFKSSSNLMQHKKTHLDPSVRPYECPLCFKTFSFKTNLNKHVGKSRCKPDRDEPLTCPTCNKVFEKEYLLKSHLKRHQTDKPFHCDKCSMKFKHKSTLDRHLLLHAGYKPYSCPICDKRFVNSGLLKPHLRVHTGEKPFKCPSCDKMFAHKHNMLRHALRHNKVKHVVCKVCHKQFPKESRLKYHMKTHINEKYFICSFCPKRFSHRQNILRHYSRKHPGKTYTGTDTDASIALKVWDSFKVKYGEEEAEEILG